ncbi:AbrB family transcriptional regulator [uncultured Cohaesibacter sp.]|uniref:AbrB family transcriptional regulator n=1 Tax=uncultured Cohaesibacter sp. TaxID=1002546 RepID=UPI0029C98999|nr:AbrB family transcriptional regulator [uncultured Cohaesibacter sp.]
MTRQSFALDKGALIRLLKTLALGALGSFVAYQLSFPAPYLTGPCLSVTIGCLFGMRFYIPTLLRNGCFIFIGLSMGSGVTPEVLNTIDKWPMAFVVLAAAIIIIFAACRLMLIRLWRLDTRTATLASSPGHLSFVLGLSSQTTADLPTVSIIQSMRVLALTVIVPFAVHFMGLETGGTPLRPHILTIPNLLILTAVGALCGWLFAKIRVPAAFLLGGMAISTLAHMSGIIEGQLPGWLTMLSLTVMGSIIGTRFSNVTLEQLRKAVTAGAAVTVLAAGIVIVIGLVTAPYLDIPLAQLLIAFSPGGLEAMSALAMIMQVDTTFVAAQHVFRLVLLSFLAPAVLNWDQRRHPAEAPNS